MEIPWPGITPTPTQITSRARILICHGQTSARVADRPNSEQWHRDFWQGQHEHWDRTLLMVGFPRGSLEAEKQLLSGILVAFQVWCGVCSSLPLFPSHSIFQTLAQTFDQFPCPANPHLVLPLPSCSFPFQSLPSPLPHPNSLCWVFSPSRFQFLLFPQLLPLLLLIWEKAVRPHPLLPLPNLSSSTWAASWCSQGSRHLLVLLSRHAALSSGHTRSRHGAQPTANPVTLLVWHWARANKPWWEAGYISLGLAPC